MVAQLMQCSSSVGGARAKTLIAWNPETNDIRSGQINAGKGYEYRLLKFDDISNNKAKDSTPYSFRTVPQVVCLSDKPEKEKIDYAYEMSAVGLLDDEIA